MSKSETTARPCAYVGYGNWCCRGGPQRFACRMRKTFGRRPMQRLFWQLIDRRHGLKRSAESV
jgi:hypothetical protein